MTSSIEPREARQAQGPVYVGLGGANLAAWGWAWAAFHDRPILLGAALLAWVLGLRHALDADHIAAIDAVVRKLMQGGRRAATVGLWFSLGHSTVVVLASLAMTLSAAALPGVLGFARGLGATVGVVVSAGFLLGMGLVNLLVLRGAWRGVRQARRGAAPDQEGAAPDQEGPADPLAGLGPLSRLLRPAFLAITRAWHMYPLGFMFGLGFDTATEVGLLGITSAQAAGGLAIWKAMAFPALFTAGMALVDTSDSILMTRAYGWAFQAPSRRLRYNLAITAASAAVAIVIGGVEALGLVGDRLGLTGSFWAAIGGLNAHFEFLGLTVVAGFGLFWLGAVALWRRRAPRAASE
jgi:high-affinity nickel-transport protein